MAGCRLDRFEFDPVQDAGADQTVGFHPAATATSDTRPPFAVKMCRGSGTAKPVAPRVLLRSQTMSVLAPAASRRSSRLPRPQPDIQYGHICVVHPMAQTPMPARPPGSPARRAP